MQPKAFPVLKLAWSVMIYVLFEGLPSVTQSQVLFFYIQPDELIIIIYSGCGLKKLVELFSLQLRELVKAYTIKVCTVFKKEWKEKPQIIFLNCWINSLWSCPREERGRSVVTPTNKLPSSHVRHHKEHTCSPFCLLC